MQKKYEAKQKELIELLKSKAANKELMSVCGRLPGLKENVERAERSDPLLELLVTLDVEMKKLEERMNKTKKDLDKKSKSMMR